MIVVLAYYGDALVRLLGRLFDWQPDGQSAGAKVT
jgi:hypothetical protein